MTNPSFATDQPAKIDLFKRKPFAKAFANSICLKKDSNGLVVGIEGPWGSGKTSVINFIKNELEQNSAKPLIIEFNPWMISGSEALVEIMLTQLASAIGDTKHKTKRGLDTAEKIVQYAELLKFLKYVPTLSWAGNIAEDSTGAAKDAIKNFKELLPGLDLTKAKNEVEKKLSNLNTPIIVIIDDIDRLAYSEIRHLFQAIKSVANFPRVTYLLAYDLNQITTAMDQEFGLNKGRSYIEKIVQISYPIPVLMPLQMLSYARSKIDDLFSRLNVKLRPFESKYLEQILGLVISLQKSPRDMVRLINRLVIAIPNTKQDINICDVIVLEAISLKYEYLRTLLYQSPEIFTGRFWFLDEHGSDLDWSQFLGDEKEERRKRWVEALPRDEIEHKALTKAFKFLFPNLINEVPNNGDLDELRVAAADRLQRYFALTSLDGSVDVADIHHLFEFPDSLETYLDFNEETILNQLSDLDKYVGSAPIADFDRVLQILINKINHLYKRNINRPILRFFSSIFIKILTKATENRSRYFSKLIELTPLCLSNEFIDRASTDLGLWRTNGTAIDQPLIEDKQVVMDARDYWERRIATESQDKDFINNINALSMIWTWWHLTASRSSLISTVRALFNDPQTVEVAAEKLLSEEGCRNISELSFIWDPEELRVILESNANLNDKYKILIKQLSQEDVIEWFKQQKAHRLGGV